ncbi:M13 family metallopeptidase [Companilactobacillus nantensis]|uniref:Neutral endopeptidase n=1 Tax=Companilactobacillus nantensis DSM 16982 TaxID=1423774 RepID=A0A0R1WNR6_9LACO|nr:M13 family metallopeptidase [Companilactobacillus nantensis]KRM17353.1 neutral endopeptidase [Companilactobacillus nantensis DSM 16982]GEO63932.1 peptidase M13 [Companilactobacillus nantensis]
MRINKIIGGAGDLALDTKPTDYKDNLYLAVNGAWQDSAQIPADKSSAGASVDLELEIEKNLMQEFHDFAENDSQIDNPELLQAVKLYRVANNSETSQMVQNNSLLKDIDRIKALKSLTDLNKNMAELDKDNFPLPLSIFVEADMKDTAKNVAYVGATDLFLPDKSYYEADNQFGQKLLAKYLDVATRLLQKLGYNPDDAKTTVQKAATFDKTLVPIVKSSEEWAEYTKIYNPYDFADFTKKSASLNLQNFVTGEINDQPEKVIVVEPRFLDNVDKLINNASFENIKAWMIVRYVMGNAEMVSEEFRQIYGEFRLARSGAKELPSRVKFAYHLTSKMFDEVVGVYYGRKYFGEKAKADVTKMIQQMIAIYKQRLSDNDWLSESTKKQAIVKLDKIVLKVGYPDKMEDIYRKLTVDESATLYDNMIRLNRILTQDNLAEYTRPVDRTKWLMPGHMVNACYDSSRNDITFPAAILQAPFYSLKQTSSENYGGIGATIAHEISHAFDNNGAQFDEYGNMHDWWTKEDYAKFKQLTQQMIDQFQGIVYAGGKVNGKLVVSENIADVGGMRCAIEAAKLEPDYDPKQFFIQWAKSWCFKATQEYNEDLLATDVHAPQPMRANVMSQDLNEFYDAFDVKPGDGMWLEPDKRVVIW